RDHQRRGGGILGQNQGIGAAKLNCGKDGRIPPFTARPAGSFNAVCIARASRETQASDPYGGLKVHSCVIRTVCGSSIQSTVFFGFFFDFFDRVSKKKGSPRGDALLTQKSERLTVVL